MCGRYTLFLTADDVLEAFDLDEVFKDWTPRSNVAPGQPVLAVSTNRPRAAVAMKWGIEIYNAQKKHNIQLINIRSETIIEKGHFRQPRYNPCLILADGFYEWRKDADRQPFHFYLKDKSPFAFAGLWSLNSTKPENPESTCVILTCKPNALVAAVHDRMPVILDRSSMRDWLSVKTLQDYKNLLLPYPDEKMECRPVGKEINRP
jgi:putative SOS response-associated peptidase YedK